MTRILLMQPLPTVAVDWLAAQGAVLSAHDGWPGDADEVEAPIYYSVPIDKLLMDRLPALRVIGKRGAGVDTLDLDEIVRRGIQVTNVGAGGNASSVCEQALTLHGGHARCRRAAHSPGPEISYTGSNCRCTRKWQEVRWAHGGRPDPAPKSTR